VPSVISCGWTLVARAYTDEEGAKFAQKWYTQLGQWFKEGKFRPQKIEIVPDGLAGVKEGLRRLKAKEVQAAKLVYNIADTPGLQGASL